MFLRVTAAFIVLLSFVNMGLGQSILTGQITDEEGEAVISATVFLQEISKGVATDEKGIFTFNDIPKGDYTIRVSYVGYETIKKVYNINAPKHITHFQLTPKFVDLESVLVSSTRAGVTTPMTYYNLDKEEIEMNNLGQDVPFLLKWSPSAVITSDAGTGIGYTGLRIRGSDPSRINVTINGIPLNDAESQQVFWVDLPDFVSSTEDIQIQRGVGASTNGTSAFGANINLSTSTVHEKPYGSLSSSIGSFNTFKGNVTFGSGLIGKGFTFDGRLSRITSDGYVDRASADLDSYFLSGAYIGDKTTLRLNLFSGHEITYQAWYGLPATYIDDEGLRTYNAAGTERADTPHSNQVDDYTQTHYQALFNQSLNKNLNLSLALHYTKGSGFYEEYKAGQSFADYGLKDIAIGEETISTTDLIRRRWLDNDYYGATYSLFHITDDTRLETTLGGAWSNYVGNHFGEVLWARYASQSETDFLYYDNDAEKQDFNTYLKFNYGLTYNLNAYLDLQYRQVDYNFLGYENNGELVDQQVSHKFFNPKAGVLFQTSDNSSLYASFAIANREPNRNDYVDSSPSSRPVAERLNDFELGFRQNWDKAAINVNAYYMLYKDELVPTGKLNDVGAYTRQNVPESYRTGIELVGGLQLAKGLRLDGNATFSQNKIPTFTEYIDNWDTWGQETIVHEDTDLAFSPNVISGLTLSYQFVQTKKHDLGLALMGKYVGKQYLDNTSNESTALEAYNYLDARLHYNVKTKFIKELAFTLLVRNVLNELYTTNGWTYRFISEAYDPRNDDPYSRLEQGSTYNLTGYYPQAGTNFLLGVTAKF